MPKKVDYIIVGLGLAGAAVALQLRHTGKRFLVIDDPVRNTSSKIAAGLFNPITGKKMIKTWLADALFPYLDQFYTEAERLTKQSFFYPMPLYRPFLTVEEQNEWMAKSADSEYIDYIKEVRTKPIDTSLNDPFGGLLLNRCGYLNTVAYLQAVRQLLEKDEAIAYTFVQANDVYVSANHIRFRDYEAETLVCCQGIHQNTWFNWLPIKPLKGETLQIHSSVKHAMILNRGVYMLPMDDQGNWRVGSTYNHHDVSDTITEKARTELEGKMNELIRFPIEWVGQDWGWRPTTPDRRPILGRHPELKNVVVFNGLGTKGVSLAPYFSQVLVRWLENGEPLNKEVDIERYKSLYSNSSK